MTRMDNQLEKDTKYFTFMQSIIPKAILATMKIEWLLWAGAMRFPSLIATLIPGGAVKM